MKADPSPEDSSVDENSDKLADSGGELQRLVDYLESEAAEHRNDASRWHYDLDFGSSREAGKQAADCSRWAALVRALSATPRTQSDRSEGDRCCCDEPETAEDEEGRYCLRCLNNLPPGAGMERSGLHND